MSMDKATVARIATLARIRVPEEEMDRLAGELGQILGWVEQLSEVDTSDVPPMTGVGGVALPWRKDEVTDGGYPEKVLANAPEGQAGFYTVAKVVE